MCLVPPCEKKPSPSGTQCTSLPCIHIRFFKTSEVACNILFQSSSWRNWIGARRLKVQEKVKLIIILRNSMHNLNSFEVHVKPNRKKRLQKIYFPLEPDFGWVILPPEIELLRQRLRNFFKFRMNGQSMKIKSLISQHKNFLATSWPFYYWYIPVRNKLFLFCSSKAIDTTLILLIY